jgi:O-antigen/teichoic acid export membrane protein
MTAPELASVPQAAADTGFALRVRSAVAWRWGSQVIGQIITWASTIAVVRLLSPSDYGLFAMSQAVITALNFMNGQSFATSLIQADRVDERRIGQVFALLLMLNGSLALIQFIAAPCAAAYYGEPLVADMLRLQAVIFLFIPFSALPQELLARRLEFRNQGKVNLASAIAGAGTALALAYFGFGVWALVWAPIAIFGVRALGLTIAARVLVKPVFDLRGAGDLVTFGGALTICQFFWIVQSQADIVIAGRVFEPHPLGLYSEALFLTLILTGRFLPPINEVAFPAYAELHKAGQPLAPYFLRTMRTVLLLLGPAYVGLALVSGPTVLTLFGEKWAAMAPLVSGLALAMPFMALQIICSPVTNSMGSPRSYLMTNAAGALIFSLLFLVFVREGPMGLVHAWWIGAPALLAVTMRLTLPKVGLTFGRLAAEMIPPVAGCAAMALAVVVAGHATSAFQPLPRLLMLVAVGAFTYGATLWLAWPQVVRESWSMLRRPGSQP